MKRCRKDQYLILSNKTSSITSDVPNQGIGLVSICEITTFKITR